MKPRILLCLLFVFLTGASYAQPVHKIIGHEGASGSPICYNEDVFFCIDWQNSRNIVSVSIDGIVIPQPQLTPPVQCTTAHTPSPCNSCMSSGTASSVRVYQVSIPPGVRKNVLVPVIFTDNNGNTNTNTYKITLFQDAANVTYGSSSYCSTSNSVPAPTLLPQTPPFGIFSSNPGGITFNQDGSFPLAGVTPDNYQISYISPNCPDTSTFELSIDAPGDATFWYVQQGSVQEFCQSLDSIFPDPVSADSGFYSSTRFLALDSSGGIDLQLSDDTTFLVTHTLLNACSTIASRSITVIADDVVNIVVDSNHCVNQQSSQSISPAINGTNTTGIWQLISGTATINSNSGIILLPPGSGGDFEFQFTSSNTNGCLGRDTATLHVEPFTDPGFIYSPTLFCKDSLDPSPSVNSSGGTFFDPQNQLVLGPNGSINLMQSPTGNHTIIHEFGGACPSRDTFQITIEQEFAGFSYPVNPVCIEGQNPQANLHSGSTIGGLFSKRPASLQWSLVDSTGEVDLAMSVPGTYTVEYRTPGYCVATSTETLIIEDTVQSPFSYTPNIFCIDDTTTSSPDPAYTTGGVFSQPQGQQGLTVSPTGSFQPSLNQVGNYIIQYRGPGFCSGLTTHPISIDLRDDASFYYVDSIVCPFNANPVPTITGVGGGTFRITCPGTCDIIDSTGTIVLANTSPNQICTVTYITDTAGSNCIDSSIATVVILPLDTGSFSFPDSSVCESTSLFSNTVTNSTIGTFASSPGGLALDPFGNALPSQSTPNRLYHITYTPLGDCPIPYLDSLEIIKQDDASFYYQDSTVCREDQHPPIILSGNNGGIFTLLNNSGQAQHLDSLTGLFTLDSVATGLYEVQYLTPGICRDSATDILRIQEQISANFELSNQGIDGTICGNLDTIRMLNFEMGSEHIDSFWSHDSLFHPDPSTGLFRANNLPPGTYTVHRKTLLGNSGCPSSDSVTFSIIPTPIAILDYDSSIYDNRTRHCDGDLILDPYLSKDSVEQSIISSLGIFSSIPAFDAPSSAFSQLGKIDLRNVSPGTYTITFTENTGALGCGMIDTVLLTVDTLNKAQFEYPGSPFCKTDPINPRPAGLDSTGLIGTFVNFPMGLGLKINPDGEIDLQDSLTVPGLHFIEYRTTGSQNCADTAVGIIQILAAPPVFLDIGPEDEPYCFGDLLSAEANSNIGPNGENEFQFSWINSMGSDSIVQPFCGDSCKSLDLGALSAGHYNLQLEVKSDSGCISVTNREFEVRPTPSGRLLTDDHIVVSSGEGSIIEVQSLSESTSLYWRMLTSNNVWLEGTDVSTLDEPIGTDLDTMEVANTPGPKLNVTNPLNLAFAEIEIYPFARECHGSPIDTVQITYLPVENLFQISALISPNGDDKNDFWVILYKENIIPDEYEIEIYNQLNGSTFTVPSLDYKWVPSNAFPDGVYYWILRRKNPRSVLKKGRVKIQRK